MTLEQWEAGIETLKRDTYLQKEYELQRTIETCSPIRRHGQHYYGAVTKERFEISPVIQGYNHRVVHIYGRAVKRGDGYKVKFRIDLSPNSFAGLPGLLLGSALCILLQQYRERYLNLHLYGQLYLPSELLFAGVALLLSAILTIRFYRRLWNYESEYLPPVEQLFGINSENNKK